MRKTKHRSIARVAANSMLNLIAYNLIRIPKLGAAWPTWRQVTSSKPSYRSSNEPREK
ncbi:MAG TPA: hypothetical protein VF493_13465 [Terriglobales bacterium]